MKLWRNEGLEDYYEIMENIFDSEDELITEMQMNEVILSCLKGNTEIWEIAGEYAGESNYIEYCVYSMNVIYLDGTKRTIKKY